MRFGLWPRRVQPAAAAHWLRPRPAGATQLAARLVTAERKKKSQNAGQARPASSASAGGKSGPWREAGGRALGCCRRWHLKPSASNAFAGGCCWVTRPKAGALLHICEGQLLGLTILAGGSIISRASPSSAWGDEREVGVLEGIVSVIADIHIGNCGEMIRRRGRTSPPELHVIAPDCAAPRLRNARAGNIQCTHRRREVQRPARPALCRYRRRTIATASPPRFPVPGGVTGLGFGSCISITHALTQQCVSS